MKIIYKKYNYNVYQITKVDYPHYELDPYSPWNFIQYTDKCLIYVDVCKDNNLIEKQKYLLEIISIQKNNVHLFSLISTSNKPYNLTNFEKFLKQFNYSRVL